MTQSPLAVACPHLATPQEQERDPQLLACAAEPGQTCRWARRYDGFVNPEFHAERIEQAAAPRLGGEDAADPICFREMVLNTGLI